MRRTATAALVLLLSLITSPLAAQVAGAGSKQITFSGGGSIGEDYQSLNATVGLTQYVSDRLEIGGFLNGRSSKSGDQDPTYDGFVFANVTFNLSTSSLTVPFVFGGVGTSLNEDQRGDLSYNVGAGFKHFVNEAFSFNGQASMVGMTIEDLEGNKSVEWGDVVNLNFGFSYYIR